MVSIYIYFVEDLIYGLSQGHIRSKSFFDWYMDAPYAHYDHCLLTMMRYDMHVASDAKLHYIFFRIVMQRVEGGVERYGCQRAGCVVL